MVVVKRSRSIKLLKNTNKLNTPRTPRPTTHIPITPPLENAIIKPLLRLFFVPSAVLAFDIVATRIPMFPATAENIAPITKANAVPQCMLLPSKNDAANKSPATMTTKMIRTLYSLFKNAIAPSRMALLNSCIFSLPALCFLTVKNRYVAKSKAITPPIGAINDIVSILYVSSL